MTLHRGSDAALHCPLALVLALGCSVDDGPTSFDSAGPEPYFDEAALREAVEFDLDAMGATALSLAVVDAGTVAWSGGFGTTRRGGSQAVDADTRFRVASVTKPMTSIALLQAVEEGCLNLDDAVADHIPFRIGVQPQHSADFAVGHTLTNTGGLIDYELQTGQEGDGYLEPFLEEFQRSQGFLSPPGRMYNYSNTNFVVAGRLVEVCADQFFRPTLEDAVWGPLDMTRTAFDQATVLSDDNYAEGLTVLLEESGGALLDVGPTTYSAAALWPAMGAWSTAHDLASLGAFLLDGNPEVLSPAHLEAMTSTQVDREEGIDNAGYGYGLNVRTGINLAGAHYATTMVSHTGYLFGYSAHLYVFPDLDLAVAALVNADFAFPEKTLDAALRLADRMTPEPIPEPDIDPARFGDFVGVFNNPNVLGDFVFTLEGGTLSVEVPGLDAEGIAYERELVPVAPDNFSMQLDGGVRRLSFLRDSAGEVEFVRNRYYVGEKTTQAAGPAPVPPPWQMSEGRPALPGW